MNRTIRRSVLVVVALGAAIAAQAASESWSVLAGKGFETAIFNAQTRGFRPILAADFNRIDAATSGEWEKFVHEVATVPDGDAASIESATPDSMASIDLEPLFNRHLKTTMRYTLSGRQVWISGAFDAKQNPYVSIWVDGAGVRYFNVKDLLGEEQHLSFAGAEYTLSLSANIFHRLKSTIALTNDANPREAARFSVQDMLDSIAAAGRDVVFTDQAYKFYYTEGLDGNHGNATKRLFVFIYGNMSDYHVYLVPEESVPAERIAVFRMYNGKRVGLSRRDGKLQIYENP